MARDGNAGAWTGFLIVSYGVVGLVGGMGTIAAQVPFERALARSAALDRVLALEGAPDRAARLEELRPLLGDSADAVMGGAGPLAGRIAAERARMFAAFGQDARDTGTRLRIVLAVFTAAAALFGVVILSIVRKQK